MHSPYLIQYEKLSISDKKRFWSKADILSPELCWEWIGKSMSPGGYGLFRLGIEHGQKSVGSHRVAWTLENQKNLGTVLVCHTCNNKSCCNPSHLYLGTHKTNAMDASRAGLLKGNRVKGSLRKKH